MNNRSWVQVSCIMASCPPGGSFHSVSCYSLVLCPQPIVPMGPLSISLDRVSNMGVTMSKEQLAFVVIRVMAWAFYIVGVAELVEN